MMSHHREGVRAAKMFRHWYRSCFTKQSKLWQNSFCHISYLSLSFLRWRKECVRVEQWAPTPAWWRRIGREIKTFTDITSLQTTRSTWLIRCRRSFTFTSCSREFLPPVQSHRCDSIGFIWKHLPVTNTNKRLLKEKSCTTVGIFF